MSDVSTSELRAQGFPINHRRPRVHPKLAAVEAKRVRRVSSTRRSVLGNRYLWFPRTAPARDLPLTRRHRARWIREYLARQGLRVRVWPKPPRSLL